MSYTAYLTNCSACGCKTSRAHARKHAGKCARCCGKTVRESSKGSTREARIIDSGWQAYAREEGHYDTGDY